MLSIIQKVKEVTVKSILDSVSEEGKKSVQQK